jgi:hypothetical protein
VSSPLYAAHGWQASRPKQPLTAAHLVITPSSPFDAPVTADLGAGLVACYRRVRSALHTVLGCDGFMISLAVKWRPDGSAIGEPEAVDSDVAVHVFGRSEGESQPGPGDGGGRRPTPTSPVDGRPG